MTRDRFINDRVRIGRGRNLLERLERLQVESNRGAGLAVIRVTLVRLARNRYPVRTSGKSADLSDDLPFCFVHHGHMVAVGYVDTPVRGIKEDQVPALAIA